MEVKDIFQKTNYKLVYQELSRFEPKEQNKLFIEYLKQRYPENLNNIYEKIAMKMSTIRFTDEILIYLLSLNLDLNYKGIDMFDTPFILKYYLASNIKSQEVMEVYLEKVKDIKDIYFGNGHYRNYTDLCRMNIIAGYKDKALEVFENNNYNLINIDYTNDIKIKELLENRDNYYIDSLGFIGFMEHDMLYQIIITIKESNLSIEEKRDILNSFIYHNKVKLFNQSSLEIIKEILDENAYNEFIDYLNNKINSKEITLFNVLNRNTIYVSNLEKVKVKKM